MLKNSMYLAASAALLAAACGDSTGPEEREQVAVRFAITADAAASTGPLTVAGSNGVLSITRAWMIVDELELEGPDDSCPGASDDECEFETGPFLLKLPLTGAATTVAISNIPAGTYTEFELEVEDLDLDDVDNDSTAVNQLWTDIRADRPDWPREASMMIEGTFTPTGGAAQSFRTYFDAEVEVEMPLVPPLVLAERSDAAITVQLDPRSWFLRADGTVRNLAEWDYATTGLLLEFDLEIEQGFDGVRIERDD